jgi:hypothetical protein
MKGRDRPVVLPLTLDWAWSLTLHKLLSDFVTKPSFSLTGRKNLLASRATISRALSRDETTAALMRGPLNSSGPSRSQSRHSIETFDCLAMREPNTNVNACL